MNANLGEIKGVGIRLNNKLFVSNFQLEASQFSFSRGGKSSPQMFQKPLPEKDVARNLLLRAQNAQVIQPDDFPVHLAKSLVFQLQNDEIVSSIEYCQFHSVPHFLNLFYYFEDRGVNWERLDTEAGLHLKQCLLLTEDYNQRKYSEMIWAAFYEILAWSFQRQRHMEDFSVFVVDSQQVLPIVDIESFHKLDMEIRLVDGAQKTPQLNLKIRDKQKASDNSSGLIDEKKNLVLFDVKEFVDLTSRLSFFGEAKMEFDEGGQFCIPVSDPTQLPKLLEIAAPFIRSTKTIEIQAHESIDETIADMMLSIFDVNGNAELELDFVSKIPSKEPSASHQVMIDPQDASGDVKDKADLREKFKDDSSPSQELKKEIQSILSEGIMALGYWFSNLQQSLKVDLPKEAQQKPPTGHDYLLFNHHGATLFIWLELLNYVLELPMTSGQLLEKSNGEGHEVVLKYLKSIMPSLLGKNETQFSKTFTENASRFFDEVITKYIAKINNWQVLMNHPQKGLVSLQDFKKKYLLILRFLLMQIFEESQGKLFLRSNFTGKGDLTPLFLKQVQEVSLEKKRTQWGKFNYSTWEMLFELNDLGIRLSFNGKEITSDTSLDFVFSVKDAEGPAGEEKAQWFDLHPEIFFNGIKVANDDVQLKLQGQQYGFVEYRGQIYRIDKKQLPNLKTLQRFWRRLQMKAGSSGFKGNQLQVLKLERSRALELLMLRQLGVKIEVSGSWQEVFDYFDKGLGRKNLNYPKTLEDVLLKHQKEGSQWLWDLYQLRLGAILADEMGLGKTLQMLGFLSCLRDKKELQKSVVVVPTSLLYNWIEEEKKFKLHLPIGVLNGLDGQELEAALTKPEDSLFLTTYGYLIENAEAFQKVNWNVVIFDEAQALKNITSQRTAAAKKLKARFKVCLTGTPMENNYVEFFSLCDLVVPGCLGDLGSFRREFRSLEVRSDLIRELKLTSKPLLLRRTKKQVELNLPEKYLHQIHLPFEHQQKDIYKQMAMGFSKQVEKLINDHGESKAQISMFSALMRLRQICSDPAAVPGVQYKGIPAKIEHFFNSIEEHLENGESVIVFTQFLATLERLKKELSLRKIEHYLLKGSISSQERLRIIGDFNKSENPAVMLMTLKTGGVGLNLTKASVVYHLEPWWNPAVENQATDRAHRMGQTKNVRVFNLLIEGSLEQKISELKVRKQAAFDKLFSNQEETIDTTADKDQALSKEDFFYLLSEE